MGKVTKPARQRTRPPAQPANGMFEEYNEEMALPRQTAPEGMQKIYELLRQHDGGSGGDVVARVYLVRGSDEYFQYLINDPTPESIQEDKLRESNKGRGGKFKVKLFVNGEESGHITHLIDDAPGLNPEVIPAGTPAAVDPAIKLILEQLAMLTAKIAAPSPPAMNMVDMVNALKGLKEITGDSKPALGVSEMVQLINLGKDIGGGSAPDSESWMGILRDVIKEAAPVVVPAFMAAAAQTNKQTPAQIPEAQLTEEDMQRMELIRLQQGIAFLKKKAIIAGSDPNVYIQLILDGETEEPFAGLIYRINTEEFSFFEKIDSELSNDPYRSYFRSIYDGIRSEYSAVDTVDNDPAGKGRNRGDAGNHGGDGTGGAA